MPYPPPAKSSSAEDYPRKRIIYELLLSVITFGLMVSITRYDPNPNGSPPVFLSPAEMNSTHEHICKIAARELDIPVGPLRYVIPHFLLCPSTYTFIGACITFVACFVKWSSLYSVSPLGPPLLPAFALLPMTIKWSRFWASVQLVFPMFLWTSYSARAVADRLFWWIMPVTYAKLAEAERERDELAKAKYKLAKERRNAGIVGDLEMGDPSEFSEQTPLTGRSSAGDEHGAYVDSEGDGQPGRESCRALQEEARGNP